MDLYPAERHPRDSANIGGGAVYHDTGNLNFSFITAFGNRGLQYFRTLLQPILFSLEALGVHPELRENNTIFTQGKKISGNAQTRKSGVVLQHGTILLDIDVDELFSILKINNEKIKDKMIKSTKDRVTSIKHILGKQLQINEVEDAMINGFKEVFNTDFSINKLTEEEQKTAMRLYKEKYSTKEWNYLR